MAATKPVPAVTKRTGAGGVPVNDGADQAALRELLAALVAARNGDFGVRLPGRRGSVMGEIGLAFNDLVEMNARSNKELARVARQVGRDGRMTERMSISDGRGAWAESAASVNNLISDLSRPTTEVARVIESVAKGDLSQKVALTIEGQPVRGEFLRIGTAVNSMVDQLSSFSAEVSRVAREVGTEGKLGGQAKVKGVSGTWKDLTDNVNSMASNLTGQVRNIAQVTTAVARGDLSQKITVDVKGEILELKNTINTMVDQLSSFADEVTRVAREVGTEGMLGGQAHVRGVSGTWKDLTDNVNYMASNLTGQVRNIAQVATAVANGDLTKKITVEAKGEVAVLAETINSMTDTLRAFADEVTRVAREVGTEGKLGGQARVRGVAGTWKDLTDSVNYMASNLTSQVRDIAQVTTAVALGDLSKKITVDVAGEILELKDTINTMVDQLSSFADEVTRVAKEVGTEGKLGGQARVGGVSGTWKDLTDNVNYMASNLTGQVRNIAQVATAVARGDLTQKITVDVAGEILELKDTINTMVDQLSSFADEVTRVAGEVGTEGILGGQADVQGVSGTWKDLTDNVNYMASNLTSQVRNIAQVTTAVARGDLTQKITVEAKGEVAVLAETINSMTDTLRAFADEVTRVAREVGTEGRLGGQAQVSGVSGTWKDLTDSVNYMASNQTGQVRNIAQVATAVANGDLTQKITVDVRGEILQLKDTINTMVDQLSSFAEEVTRVAREVGTEGKLGGQAQVRGVSGTWKDLTDSVNYMASNLTGQVRNIAQVTTAVANGDLTQKITVDVQGEILQLKNTINTMVDQLSSFADEVTRVAREVGTEGRLGGQAQVRGVSGTWKDLTDSVNSMADSLTSQVRDIAQVTTAVANGELTKKITVDVRGEILQLKNTINTMVDQLSSFAAEVTRVAREVGTEGRLGGQARVGGVSGTWKDLTDNVNIMASSLTTQVRAIAEVATAVTQGDLSRSITVEAQGEVADLKDNINQMIGNLAETTRVNEEQDWLKTNLARISGLMQGQRDLKTLSRLIMNELTPTVSAQHGAFFLSEPSESAADKVDGAADADLSLIASYGYKARKNVPNRFKVGEALVGQAALERSRILVTEAPGDYVKIASGLGEAEPVNLVVLPVVFEDQVLGVIELAALRSFSEVNLSFLDQVIETIGVVLNTIIATMRTEELLEQSQRLTQELQAQSLELQTQQEELQQTNEELQEKARLLAEQNRAIEVKNREIEMARLGLEEKAQQLAVSSRYKSEFLANMSHELRTPLNALLIMAKLLSENPDGNLTDKQVDFSRTIHGAGSDLLDLINDILDLSKVEAGKMDVVPAPVRLGDVAERVRQGFAPLAGQKGLSLEIAVDPDFGDIVTDEQRLHQVLKNLMSNAVKFTEEGTVSLSIGPAPAGIRYANPTLAVANGVVAFSVSDTGVGIAPDKLRLVFEAFQQADGTTSRRYGGTGLGLSISREIARLLGGELRVESALGQGSTFVLFLPDSYSAAEQPPANTLVTAVITGGGPAPGLPMLAGADDAGPSLVFSRSTELSLDRGAGDRSPAGLEDDRGELTGTDAILLVVQTDPEIAREAAGAAHAKGRKMLAASRAATALAIAREFRLEGILLDAELNGDEGSALLAHLKQDPELRHIPVYAVSAPEARRELLRLGAFAFSPKPLDREQIERCVKAIVDFAERPDRTILVVEDDQAERAAVTALLGSAEGVAVRAAESVEEAASVLEGEQVDCIVLDLKLPKASGFALLERLKADDHLQDIPVIVYTGKELTRREETRLSKYVESIIVKDARSPERLLAETTLFLHQPRSGLPREQRVMLDQLQGGSEILEGKTVLIVDDDVRNVFALTSVLERHGMGVVFAENGREAISMLSQHPEVQIVLMDIMMPEMDGYETMAEVRRTPAFAKLPIIALTAKAMKGDREKSIEAGASDYITKPVDVEQLISLMRVWLYN
ncbi:MAG: hybrid sensor histidine kinase/response regulator [Acidimicrobiales bacterium]